MIPQQLWNILLFWASHAQDTSSRNISRGPGAKPTKHLLIEIPPILQVKALSTIYSQYLTCILQVIYAKKWQNNVRKDFFENS